MSFNYFENFFLFCENIGFEEFTKFQKDHPLSSFYQTSNYAVLMAETGYDYDLIALKDEQNNIHAASLILIKPIGFKYFY